MKVAINKIIKYSGLFEAVVVPIVLILMLIIRPITEIKQPAISSYASLKDTMFFFNALVFTTGVSASIFAFYVKMKLKLKNQSISFIFLCLSAFALYSIAIFPLSSNIPSWQFHIHNAVSLTYFFSTPLAALAISYKLDGFDQHLLRFIPVISILGIVLLFFLIPQHRGYSELWNIIGNGIWIAYIILKPSSTE